MDFTHRIQAKSFTFTHLPDEVRIQIEDDELIDKYCSSYNYDQLPIEFKVIFEDLQEFFAFLTSLSQDCIHLENTCLHVRVPLLGKLKDFSLPLLKLDPTTEQLLRKSVRLLEFRLEDRSMEVSALELMILEKDKIIVEKAESVDFLEKQLEKRQLENAKLNNKVRLLENNLEDLMTERNKHQDPAFQESRLTEDLTPVKRTQHGPAKVRKVKQEDYGQRMIFRIDDNAKHRNKFRIAGNEVEKLHGPTYQLYHEESLAKEGRFYFDIKILLIKNSNIVVGLITDKNKEQQFSFKKINCVCYNGYDGSICEQEKQIYVNIKPKEGTRLRTVVDMTQNIVEWFILGGDSQKSPIGRTHIPASMSRQPLYPYFQLYWEGNKLRLNP